MARFIQKLPIMGSPKNTFFFKVKYQKFKLFKLYHLYLH